MQSDQHSANAAPSSNDPPAEPAPSAERFATARRLVFRWAPSARHRPLVVAALIGVLVGALLAWWLTGASWRERTRELTGKQEADLEAIRTDAANWAETVSQDQAEAIMRAFVSGLSPALLAQRFDSVEISCVALLRVNAVLGIHVLRPDGTVIYSSDAKLNTTGVASERAAWAVNAKGLSKRPGLRAGTLEYALPVVSEVGDPLSIVWMEYALSAVLDPGRPASLTSSTPAKHADSPQTN